MTYATAGLTNGGRTARIDAKIGRAILFIYYLHTQLGYGITSIIAAAAPGLAGVYKNLAPNRCAFKWISVVQAA